MRQRCGLGAIDPQHGGLPGAPKFPQAPIFALLWRVYLETGQDILRDAVVSPLPP